MDPLDPDRIIAGQLKLDAAKAGAAWAAVGITNWSDFAAFLAAVYSAILICEWIWKRLLRPAAEKRGLVKRKYRRRASDREETDHGDL